MGFIKLIAPLAFLVLGAVVVVSFMSRAQAAQVQPEAQAAPKVTQLVSENLPDLPGKEGVIITVEYPPGGSDPMHRHNADVFVYMLEGSVVMQLRGGAETTLNLDENYERVQYENTAYYRPRS